MNISNIISGAVILIVVIGIYIAASYMRSKKIGGDGGCSGNCASCSMHRGGGACPDVSDNAGVDKEQKQTIKKQS